MTAYCFNPEEWAGPAKDDQFGKNSSSFFLFFV